VRHIFVRKPRREKRFQIALPELSGPKARKKLARTPQRAKAA